MRITEERLNAIYDRTSGYCHLCHKKLAFTNYGRYRHRGAWEIEHSVARVRGGTDRLCNLYAACIRCNRRKQHYTTRTARRWNGKTCAPLSVARRARARFENTLTGGRLGLLCGLPFGGIGALFGSAVGGFVGHWKNPE